MVGRFLQQTRREKRAHSAALSLFFGALLGANLGTVEGLSLYDYIYVVLLLAGTITTLHLSVASERRGYMGILLLFYFGLFVLLYLQPERRPAMPEEDLLKLVATLAIWFGAVAMVEFTPTLEAAARTPLPEDPAA